MPVAMLLVAAAFRLPSLSWPSAPVWDEHYYVFDASAYIGGGVGIPVGSPPSVRIADEGTWVHPPLGKWMIALLGIGPLGFGPSAWRFPAVLFGLIGVLLLYLVAREMWGSVFWAGLASLLLAVDGIHIVQSRIAMLDIFASTFILAGTLFLVRERTRGSSAEEGRLGRWFGSRERLLAGLFFGAAVATKWSGVFALVFGALLCGYWALKRSPSKRTIGQLTASFLFAPFLVYLLSYGSFWYQHGPDVVGFARLQAAMFDHQIHHSDLQPENSSPASWPLLTHPIRYYPDALAGPADDRSQNQGEILLVGNPVLFWGFLALLPFWLAGSRRQCDWRDALALGGYVALYVPWFFMGRTQFLWYILPAIPFMCLAVVASLRRLGACASGSAIAIATMATIAGVAFWPLWTGVPAPAVWVENLRLMSGWG